MGRGGKRHGGSGHDASQSRGRRARTLSGSVDSVSWLSDDILLIVGCFPLGESSSPEISLMLERESVPLDARCLSYSTPALAGAHPRVGGVLLARVPGCGDAPARIGRLLLRRGPTAFWLSPLDLSEAVTDLKTLLREGLAGLRSQARLEIMEFLTAALDHHPETANVLRLSKSLFMVREALRERLPSCVIAQDRPLGLHVDAVMAIDARSFYIKGWMRDVEASVTHLTAASPEGTRAELLGNAFLYPRPDVDQFYGCSSAGPTRPGFISYFKTPAPSYLSSGWIVEMRDAAGTAMEATAPPAISDMVTVRDLILQDIAQESVRSGSLMLKCIFPAISRLQERHREAVEVESVDCYGAPPESPDVSIIVPLFRRIDFLEHQLAQFIHDREIQQADLVYVLDSPELADSLRSIAARLFRLYRVPFRVVMPRLNAGFAAANNIGASFASGRLLLLLNSDILPDRPGWLGAMMTFYDSTPGIGALGPKLLFEDDSLQHAGMYFSRLPDSCEWANMHYFKGLDRRLPAANVARPVPAVTAACMMIAKGLYAQLGGLRGIYVQGDFEDSDFCLRLIEAGHENWYFPQAELYHLEGQSYPLAMRQLNARYNRWLHTRLWNERIEAVMSRWVRQAAGNATRTNEGGCELP